MVFAWPDDLGFVPEIAEFGIFGEGIGLSLPTHLPAKLDDVYFAAGEINVGFSPIWCGDP
jgi:hypothetical protein